MGHVFSFEDIGDDLPLLPLAARRALDVAGRRLSLSAWQRLSLPERQCLVREGSNDTVDVSAVTAAIATAEPAASPISADDESRLSNRPAPLPLSDERWAELSKLQRFAILHLVKRDNAQRLREALAEIAPARPTHIDEHGDARMVDVGEKSITHRRAVARAVVRMKPQTAQLVTAATAPKGDVLATARIAAIMGAKRTSDLIPLCHPIALSRVDVSFDVDAPEGRITVMATADAHDRTGVEMEAMTAASVAALTIYDMLKGIEKGIVIGEIVLVEKRGGRSGHYRHESASS